MMNSNHRHSEITLQQIKENIAKLSGVPGYRDIAKVLEENPAYYFRFVRDITATGGDIESLLKSSESVGVVPVGPMEIARRILHMILALPSNMAGGMNPAPAFATTDAEYNAPEHCLRQIAKIGEEGSGESIEIVCESYANHPHAVDLKLAVVNPKTLVVGDRMGITLSSGGENAPRAEVTLADDRKGGLYGLGEFAMPWDKFASYGTKEALEIDIDFPSSNSVR